MAEPPTQADLSVCEREPIHQLGVIQPHAYLLEVSSDWIVTRASANIERFVGLAPEAAIGHPLAEILGRQATHAIRGQLQISHLARGTNYLNDVQVNGAAFNLALTRQNGTFLIEAEHTIPGETDAFEMFQPLMQQLRGLEDRARLLSQIARQVRALTGFDRVMIYAFHPDGSGEVVAETRRSDMTAFKGLHYPASDIPRQARALYQLNTLRLIADVDATPVPILPERDPDGNPVDLSLSVSRAVSPIHLEYLRNMGVAASMSISLLVGGKLWGLIACHHRKPRLLSIRARASLTFFGSYASSMLETMLLKERAERQDAARAVHADVMQNLVGDNATLEDLMPQLRRMQDMIGADGLATYVDSRLRLVGATPGEGESLELMRFLNRVAASRIYATHALSLVYPEAAAYAGIASGLLAIPVSRKPRDFVVFFRREIIQHVNWAGDPRKSVTVSPGEQPGDEARISPRKSFDSWRETVIAQSQHWAEADLDIAEALRVALIEFMLQVTDRAEKQRRLAGEQQDLLIAELNHRVRNILNLIVGLVRQIKETATDLDSFATEVAQRVHALARAHDQLTSSGWGPRSLVNLIRVEAAAYLAEKAQRILIHGQDVFVSPNAFATLALVIHELVTNAAKYGAFRDSVGTVDIELASGPAGLVLHWREQGGGPVAEPIRRGFGSTIIERAVPHELSGTAEMRFEPDGLQVRITVPANYVVDAATISEPRPSPARTDLKPVDRLGGSVLLVEDNLLIALETEDALYLLGAEDVHIASTVAGALALLRDNKPHFAVLDYNLGSESSSAIAERLDRLGIPFVLATGYGDTAAIDSRFRDRPIIAKPYTAQSLLTAYNDAVAHLPLAELGAAQ